MLSIERQEQIIDLLNKKSPMSVRELGKKLFVSEATIRRDLSEMEEQLLIRRIHGGAVLPENEHEETGLTFRLKENVKEKEKIVNLALPFVLKSKSIFMDASSTCAILSNGLKTNYSTIVTTGMETALCLSKADCNNVILIGGNVAHGTSSVSGAITLTQLSNFNFDIAIMSCSGIDKDFFATEKTFDQSAIKQQVLSQSSIKILLADNTKFTVTNLAKICSLKEFDYIITDKKPSEKFVDFAQNNNIKIIY